jgi:hypothetical protein
MKMSQKQLENWARIRQRGRTRYVWFNGVLCWGLSTGVLWAVTMAAVQGWQRLPLLLAIALIGFPLGGYFVGRCTWKLTEARFQQASRDKPDA